MFACYNVYCGGGITYTIRVYVQRGSHGLAAPPTHLRHSYSAYCLRFLAMGFLLTFWSWVKTVAKTNSVLLLCSRLYNVNWHKKTQESCFVQTRIFILYRKQFRFSNTHATFFTYIIVFKVPTLGTLYYVWKKLKLLQSISRVEPIHEARAARGAGAMAGGAHTLRGKGVDHEIDLSIALLGLYV